MKILNVFGFLIIFGGATSAFATTNIEYNTVDTVRIVKLNSDSYFSGVNAAADLTKQITKICGDQRQVLEASLVKCGWEDGFKLKNTFSCIGVCK